jgi:peptide/nickel transport system permease protein
VSSALTVYVGRRVVETIGALVGVSFIVFLLLHLVPGDVVTAILGHSGTPQGIVEMRHRLGLDRPWYLQYFDWLGRTLHGDFGFSIALSRPVSAELGQKMLNTWILAAASSVIAVGLGTTVGLIAALRPASIWDRLLRHTTVALASTPVFWLGLVLVYFFSIRLSLLPALGMRSITGNGGFPDLLKHLVLPATATATFSIAIIARTVRAVVLDILSKPFVTAARARGFTERRILWRHVAANALPSVVSMFGLQIGYLFSGVLLTEVVFAWPGIGQLLFSSISARDVPVIQAVTLLVAVQFTTINLLADIVRVVVDPRSRV